MRWSYSGLVAVVSALVTASILLFGATARDGSSILLIGASLVGILSLAGVVVLIRATVMLERQRGSR